MTFTEQLAAAWQNNDSLLCVGLDPDPAKFPAHLKGRDDAIFEFCKTIVDATADLVCSFKPQIAYFAARRAEDQLEALIAHIHEKHPGIPVILDAKRGDIGSTAEQYAVEAFERFRADAVTVNPYMGRDSVERPRRRRHLPGRNRPRARNRRRDAATGAGYRRPGRRHRGYRHGRPHCCQNRPDDQFLARHPLCRPG